MLTFCNLSCWSIYFNPFARNQISGNRQIDRWSIWNQQLTFNEALRQAELENANIPFRTMKVSTDHTENSVKKESLLFSFIRTNKQCPTTSRQQFQEHQPRTERMNDRRRRHNGVAGAVISVNTSSPACLSFLPHPLPSGLWERFMVHLISRKISASFLQIVLRWLHIKKLLRVIRVTASYGVSCLTAAKKTVNGTLLLPTHGSATMTIVCITTNQPDNKSNPTAKQHAIVNIQLDIVTCPMYQDKLIRDNVVAPLCYFRL